MWLLNERLSDFREKYFAKNRQEWTKSYIKFTASYVQYVFLGPRESAMPLVRVFSENDKILRREKKYVE